MFDKRKYSNLTKCIHCGREMAGDYNSVVTMHSVRVFRGFQGMRPICFACVDGYCSEDLSYGYRSADGFASYSAKDFTESPPNWIDNEFEY